MTGRTTPLEGSTISQADVARRHEEERLHGEWQRRTVRVVASAARDAEDCRLLLDILGLDDEIVAAARSEERRRKTGRKGRAHAA